jgi:DNA ligase-1
MIKELQVLQSIAACTGKGSQEQMQAIIKKNLTPELEFLLEVAYNPFIVTKVNKLNMKAGEIEGPSSPMGLASLKALVEKLKSVKAANSELREEVIWAITSYPVELQQTMYDVLTKNLNIGIQAKSINKAAGRELIPNPSLMLAQDDVDEIENWDKIYCEHKYDGVRIIALFKDGNFQYFTRNFNQVPTEYMKYVNDDLLTIVDSAPPEMDFEGWFFDGELTDFDRKSVSGKLNRMLKGKVDGEISHDFIFNVFDIEMQDVLVSGKGKTKYTDRRYILQRMFNDAPKTMKNVQISELWLFNSVTEMTERYKEIVKFGGEGVICKNDSVYECKRSKNWIKLKEVNDSDLVVTGWIAGEGRRTGYVGGLICEDSTGTLKVGVGSGFTDADLEMFNELINNNQLIGKVVAVQYNLRIQDKHGNESMFLPRFIEIRSDKTEADNIKNIK